MIQESPNGISENQWALYNKGRKLHAEGLGSESVNCYFNARSRAWVAAGWHDADIEAGGKTVHALIKELLQCTQ